MLLFSIEPLSWTNGRVPPSVPSVYPFERARLSAVTAMISPQDEADHAIGIRAGNMMC
jgi:hypothetical protein